MKQMQALKNTMRWLLATLLVLVVTLGGTTADAGVRRALLVGSNAAPPGLVPLRYAHDDARKLYDVLVELGGVERQNAQLLLEPSAAKLRTALQALRSEVEDDQQIFFYYSGHANAQGLLLGKERVSQTEIQALLSDERARVRVAILDACQSGAVSQTKGGIMRPRVDIQWAVDPAIKGAVLITSSTAEEASVERDDLGGSLFSHFLVSGLRGGADVNQNREVTLEEAFSYAYEHTLARSTESRAGLQHPTYEYRIAGQKQLVVSWLERPSYMSFGVGASGSYVVFDRSRGQVVAELTKEPGSQRKLWLPAGDYFIKKRLPSSVLVQKVGLSKGSVHQVRDHDMHTVPYEEDVTKGHASAIFQPSWQYGAPYIHNTAHTLRRGEISVGLQRAEVGLNDEVTLSMSVWELFWLSPSIVGKYRLFHGENLIWSMQAGFLQSFYGTAIGDDARSFLQLQAGTSLSLRLGSPLTISAVGKWMLESAPDIEDIEWEIQNVVGGASVTWALGENDLLQIYGEGRYTVHAPSEKNLEGDRQWAGSFFYAHAFGSLKVALGVKRGSLSSSGKIIGETNEWQPMVDIWWRW